MDFDEAVCDTLLDTNFLHSVKDEQVAGWKALAKKTNVFAVLPTGFGKSLIYGFLPTILDKAVIEGLSSFKLSTKIIPCETPVRSERVLRLSTFFCPPRIIDLPVKKMRPQEDKHIAVVISPLRALMADQRLRWEKLGVPSYAVAEVEANPTTDIDRGEYSLIFMAPEAALSEKWQKMLKKIKARVCLLAMDEAHCMIEWGNTFRPTYREVGNIRAILTGVPVCCLTATCTSGMQKEICGVLGMDLQDFTHITVIPNRENIYIDWRIEKQAAPELLDWYIDRLRKERENTPKCIVYCRTQQQQLDILSRVVEQIGVCNLFVGASASPGQRLAETFYHGIGKTSEQDIPASFKEPKGPCRLLIATIAFGLGMDVPDVEYIVHWGPASSYLNYWQEIGRGGRDGRLSKAILYAPPLSIHKSRVDQGFYECLKSQPSCIRKACLVALMVHGMKMADIEAACGGRECCSQCSKTN